jgi:hypothetical protein
MRNLQEGNDGEARKNFVRARSFAVPGGINGQEFLKITAQASQENNIQIDRLRFQRAFGKNTPAANREQAIDSAIRNKKIDNNK